MSELPGGVAPAAVPTPRPSAAGIIARRDEDGEWEVVTGVRSRRSRFMPGHLSFPGGVMEEEDRPGARGARSRCVSREVREETGIAIPAERWLSTGRRITPALFPLRFDNEFFVTEWVGKKPDEWKPETEEIESLGFVRPAEVVEGWSRGRKAVPPPVLAILRGLVGFAGTSLGELRDRIAETNDLEQRAPRIEFVPEVWMLPVRSDTMPPSTHTNCWMPGGARFVVIDPGSPDDDEAERLLAVAGRRAEIGQTPTAVLLTHHHQDHVGGVERIARSLGVPVHAHPRTLDAVGWSSTPPRLEPLHEGETLELDGMVLRALHTPGHAAGHLAFEIVDRGVLIAGDLISGISTILIHPEHGDMDEYLASLDRVREAGYRTLLPSHGPPLPGRALDKLIEHRADRERRIVETLGDAAASLSDIARGAYPDAAELPLALLELQTLAHLVRLERAGRARRTNDAARGWARVPV